MTLLSDLRAETVEVICTATYGKSLTVTLKVPSFHKRQELLNAVPFPSAPMTGWDRETGKKVANTTDPDYLQAMGEAYALRSYRLLVWALVEGGMDIPGDDLDEQVAAFRASEPDAGIVDGLLRFMQDAGTGARVETRAENFRRLHASETEGLPVNGFETERVGATDGRRKR